MDLIINISMYLSYLLEGYITYMYFGAMFERRQKSILTRIVLYITGFSALYVVYLLGNSAVNMVAAVVVMVVLGVAVFETGLTKALFHSGVIAVMLVISESLVISLFNMVFSVNAASINTPPVIVTVSISSKLLMFMGCRFITSIAVKDRYRSKWSPLLLLVPVASMLCLLIIFHQSARLTLSFFENILNCGVSVLLLCANLLVFYVYERSVQNEQELSQIKLSEQRRKLDYDYYKMLEEHRRESRIVIHDIKHHLNLIRCMAEDWGNSEVCDYIESIQKESYFCKSATLSGNKIADVILSRKSFVCRQKGIEFLLEHNNTDLSFVSDWDLCAVLSNALDNAIESAQKSEEKLVQVRFYRAQNRGFCFLEIINSCDKAPEKNHKGYKSTKSGKYHGIGLYSIRQVAEKYHGQLVTQYTEDKKFRTTVMLQDTVD